MEVEQRCVVKFFKEEDMPGVQIISGLRDYYGEDILSRTQIYFWINRVKRSRTDFNNTASPGRKPDESLAGAMSAKLDADPHLSSLISQRESWRSLRGLQHQRSVDI
jgi:hypothetical protein